ncbi:MAG: alpha/beta hydrolase-fold protein [Pedococcus sp.]
MSTVSRREVLVGAAAGALTLAGCGASSPERRSGTLRSEHWPGRDVRWEVALPERDLAQSPVVIVLHGKGGTARYAFDGLRLHDHVAATGLTLAAVDGGDGYWHARRSGVDSGAMVVHDFLPLVRRLGGYQGRVAFLGWSMGGYGSLLLASQLGPTTVGAIVAESAALWTGPEGASPGAFDDREDYLAHDVFSRTDVLAQIPVRLDCGDRDPFVAGNRAFAEALPSAELTIDDGGHTVAYWREHARSQLEWIAAKL